eukprot:GFUD01006352.1.p1 GENE.GFUD01006352.1~~GFUD01006352.1.p1  ORF type:complete len:385 (+),score=158.70 GFUD01006352.1:61-1215(+)
MYCTGDLYTVHCTSAVIMAVQEGIGNTITRQVAMTVQCQQRVQELNRQMKTIEEERKEARKLISLLDQLHTEAEVYSKVGRLYIRAERTEVVGELERQVQLSNDKMVSMGNREIFLKNQLRESEACLREETAMEPLNSLCRAVVMFTHSHTHLRGRKVWLVFNTPTGPRLQEGPQCGIVALVVAACAMRVQGTSVDRVMDMAREDGFTKKGEMFSVDNMAVVAKRLMECEVKVERASKLLDTKWLVDRLLREAIILVPYDCAPDNHPCQAKGHKAHWAVITGFLLPSTSLPPHTAPLPACPGFHLLSTSSSQGVQHVLHHTEQATIMLVARQSKSVELGIWSRDKLVDSCMNLQEAAQKRLDGTYVVPEGGLRKGLCGRVVVVG